MPYTVTVFFELPTFSPSIVTVAVMSDVPLFELLGVTITFVPVAEFGTVATDGLPEVHEQEGVPTKPSGDAKDADRLTVFAVPTIVSVAPVMVRLCTKISFLAVIVFPYMSALTVMVVFPVDSALTFIL